MTISVIKNCYQHGSCDKKKKKKNTRPKKAI